MRVVKKLMLTACAIASCFFAVTTWAAEFQINQYTSGTQSNEMNNPSIATNGSNYLVTWWSDGQDGSGNGVYGALVAPDGTILNSDILLNTYTTNSQRWSSVASDGTNYFATWETYGQDSSTYSIYGQLIDGTTGAKIGNEFPVYSSSSGYLQAVPSITYNSVDNEYIVAWQSEPQDGSGYGLYAQRFSQAGAKIGGEVQLNNYTTNSQNSPQVAFDGSQYLITWHDQQQDGNLSGIFGRRFSTSLTPLDMNEFQINTYTTGYQDMADVTHNGDTYLVVWEGEGLDGSSYGVYGRRYDADGNALDTQEFVINSNTTSTQNHIISATNGQTFLVTWEDWSGIDGSGSTICAQLFDADGNFLGSNFQVNLYSSGDQRYADIATMGLQYMISWVGEGAGDDSGVYANFINATDYTIFAYLTDAGADDEFDVEWTLTELNTMYDFYENGGAPIDVNSDLWYRRYIDLAQMGVESGDFWTNNGEKYMYLNGVLISTDQAYLEAIPEPFSLVLVAMGITGLAMRKRRA